MTQCLKIILQLMEKVEPKNTGLYMLFKANNKKNEKWKVSQIGTSDNLGSEVLNLSINYLENITKQKSLRIINYEPGPSNDKNIVEKINIHELSEFKKIKQIMDSSGKKFKNKNDYVGYKPFVFIVKLSILNDEGNTNILLFQHIQKQNAIQKGRIIGRFKENFEYLKEELFYLSDSFDCIWCEYKGNKYTDCIGEFENMFIFNKKKFDWIFGFEEKFKNEIKSILNSHKDEIEDMIDINQFKNYVLGDYQHIRKTYKLLKNGNFFKYFDKEIIDKVVEEANLKKIKWKNNKIVVEKENIKELLDILDENYLKSMISETVFLSLSKVKQK